MGAEQSTEHGGKVDADIVNDASVNRENKVRNHPQAEEKDSGEEGSVRSGSVRSKTSAKSRTREEKRQARKSLESAVDLLEQAEEDSFSLSDYTYTQAQTSQFQPLSFTAVNNQHKQYSVPEIKSTPTEKLKKPKKQRKAEKASQLPSVTENFPAQFEEHNLPDNGSSSKKRRGLKKKHISEVSSLLAYDDELLHVKSEELVPEEKNVDSPPKRNGRSKKHRKVDGLSEALIEDGVTSGQPEKSISDGVEPGKSKRKTVKIVKTRDGRDPPYEAWEEQIGQENLPHIAKLVNGKHKSSKSTTQLPESQSGSVLQQQKHLIPLAQSLTIDSGHRQSLTLDPGSTQSLTYDPGYNESLTPDPGYRQSLTFDPGHRESLTLNPGFTQSITYDPGHRESLTLDPGSTQSIIYNPGHRESLTLDPGSTKSITHNPGNRESLTSDPGYTQSLTFDPGHRESLTPDPGSTQLLTLDPGHRKPTPDNQLSGNAVAVLAHLNENSQSSEPQPISSPTDDIQQLAPEILEVADANHQNTGAKRKRISKKSTKAVSSSVLRKKRKFNNKAEMDLTDEEIEEAFDWIMGPGSDLVYDDHDRAYSSPPPHFSDASGFMENQTTEGHFPDPQKDGAPEFSDTYSTPYHPIDDAFSSPLETNLSPVLGYVDPSPQPTPTRGRRSKARTSLLESVQDMAAAGEHLSKPRSTKLRNSLMTMSPPVTSTSVYRGSLKEGETVTYAEESAVPMIGIYTKINGVFHRKEISSTIGKDNDELWKSDDIFANMQLDATLKKKRRAKTEDDSIFDIPEIESEPKAKRKRASLKPKTPMSAKLQDSKSKSGKSSKKIVSAESPSVDESRGSKRRSYRAKGTNEPSKKGKFEEDEIKTIADEMVKFRESHNDMSEVELNQLVQDDAGRAGELWDQLCDALPERARQAIMKICRRRYHNYGGRGKWTDEEDQSLRDAFDIHPKAWKKIGDILNRHPEDTRDRWRNYLICGDKQKKAAWTKEEENTLRSAIEECVDAIREKRKQNGQSDPSISDIELVDWQMVSQKMDHTRSRLQCLTKWKGITARQDSENGEAKDLEMVGKSWRIAAAKKTYRQMDSNDKLHLLYGIRQSQAGREGKVPFRVIGDDEFQRKWPCMVRKVAWKKLRATVPGNDDLKLQEIVNILIDKITDNPGYADFHKTEELDEDSKKALRKVRRKSGPKPVLSEKLVADKDVQGEELDYGQLYKDEDDEQDDEQFYNDEDDEQDYGQLYSDDDEDQDIDEDHDIDMRDVQRSPSPSVPENPLHTQPRNSSKDYDFLDPDSPLLLKHKAAKTETSKRSKKSKSTKKLKDTPRLTVSPEEAEEDTDAGRLARMESVEL